MAGYNITDRETTSQEIFIYPVTFRGSAGVVTVPFRHVVTHETKYKRVTGLTYAQAVTEKASIISGLKKQVTRYVIAQEEGQPLDVVEVTGEEQCGEAEIRRVGGSLWEVAYTDITDTETASLVWGEQE